jgi:UDP:flavonoid glycosyltransferase YjiC (YdhE family)
MHVFIVTIGTRGDLELFLMLGRALRRRRHQVVLGTSPFYLHWVRQAGLDGIPLGDGTLEQLLKLLYALVTVGDRTQRTLAFYKFWVQAQVAQAMPQITTIGAGTDYFVSNLKMMLRRQGQVVPGAAVTYDLPASPGELEEYRTGEQGGRIIDLVALNKQLADPEDSWGLRYHFTGFWQPEQTPARPLPAELEAFAAQGSPPVVLTMGSMVMFDAARLASAFDEALRLTGRRGVLVGGWSEMANTPRSPERLFCLREAPYDSLFPRAACVIHHGGCGTIAAVLRAGRPSIVLPQVTCQELFGQRLVQEQLAAGLLEATTLSAEDLAALIDRAASDPALAESAHAWQLRIARDGGVQSAADLIDAHADQIHGWGAAAARSNQHE